MGYKLIFPVPLAIIVTPFIVVLPPGIGKFPWQGIVFDVGEGVGVFDGVLDGVTLGDTVIVGVTVLVGVGVGDGEAPMFGWNETLLQLGICEAPPTIIPVLFIWVTLYGKVVPICLISVLLNV